MDMHRIHEQLLKYGELWNNEEVHGSLNPMGSRVAKTKKSKLSNEKTNGPFSWHQPLLILIASEKQWEKPFSALNYKVLILEN